MRCPKCRNEVSNQPVCPYCGATVYIQGTALEDETMPHRSVRYPGQGKNAREKNELEKRLRLLETRVNLLLVLQCGSFVLLMLLVVLQALS